MRILSIDQSLTASAAVLLEENSPGVLVIGEQRLCRPKSKGIHRMMEIRGWLDKIIKDCRPDMLVREMHHMRQFGAAGALQALTAVIDMLAYEGGFLEDYRYAMIAPGTWKKLCMGKGNFKKDTAYMMHMNRFFTSTEFLQTPDGFEVEDDNIADAICMGVTGYYTRQVMKELEHKTTQANATALRKVSDNMFNYGNV